MPQMNPLSYMMMYLCIIMLLMTFMVYIYFQGPFNFPSKFNYNKINFKW